MCKNCCAKIAVQKLLCKNCCAKIAVQKLLCQNCCAKIVVQKLLKIDCDIIPENSDFDKTRFKVNCWETRLIHLIYNAHDSVWVGVFDWWAGETHVLVLRC